MKTQQIKQKINEFMEWKAKEIKYLLSEYNIPYYTPKDAEAIEKLEQEHVHQIYAHFKNIADGILTLRSDRDHCPFCIVYSDICDLCPYGKNHLICKDERSDYSKILAFFGCSIRCGIGKMRITKKIQELFKKREVN